MCSTPRFDNVQGIEGQKNKINEYRASQKCLAGLKGRWYEVGVVRAFQPTPAVATPLYSRKSLLSSLPQFSAYDTG